MKKVKRPDYLYFSFSWKELGITLLILLSAFALSYIIYITAHSNVAVTLIFVLAVVFTARFTNGCFFGILSSIAAVVAVNYAFTYPYFAFDFTLAGYPLTFITMLTVSMLISMLTAQTKKHAYAEAEREKERMRANLLRSVSHDIRTPLTSIIGSASAYLENHSKLSEESCVELISDVKSDAQWLIRMVENILSVTRIGEDSAYINKNPEMAEEIIGEAVLKFRKSYGGVNVATIIPEEIIFIPMDAILIEQVIVNLMENSVLHGECTDKITVSLSCDDKYAIFSVEDNGAGIEGDISSYITGSLLSHRSTASADEKRCMGIGLSVCTSIIKAHGGELKGENKKTERGAVFSFTLPLE